MTLSNYYNKSIPEYYPTMYLDGYTPEQILNATRKKMRRQQAERMAALAEAEDETSEVKITSEVKMK